MLSTSLSVGKDAYNILIGNAYNIVDTTAEHTAHLSTLMVKEVFMSKEILSLIQGTKFETVQ